MDIMKEMEHNYDQALEEGDVPRGNKDWYRHSAITIDRLEDVIDASLLREFVIHHMVDMLSFNDKHLVISILLEKSAESMTKLERTIKSYLDDNIRFESDGRFAYMIINKNKPDLYLVSDAKLVKAEPLDYKDFAGKIKMRMYPPATYNDIIGFIINIRGSENKVFKTKEVDLKRNTGARCDQAGKKTVLRIINKIVENDDEIEEGRYTTENTKTLKGHQMCSEQEFLLRYYKSIQKDDKIWFLTYEEAILNDIAKLSR
jgi:hypothetical protein